MDSASSTSRWRSGVDRTVPVGLCGVVTLISRVVPGRTAAATRSMSSRQPASNATSTMLTSAPIARGVSRLVA